MPWTPGRRVLSWVLLAAAAGLAVVDLVDAMTGPLQGQEADWGTGLTEALLAGGPLVAVAVGLRSTRRTLGRVTAVAALGLALVVTLVLVMQLLDPNEILRDRLIQGVGLSAYLAAATVEMPAFTHRWPPDPPVGVR